DRSPYEELSLHDHGPDDPNGLGVSLLLLPGLASWSSLEEPESPAAPIPSDSSSIVCRRRPVPAGPANRTGEDEFPPICRHPEESLAAQTGQDHGAGTLPRPYAVEIVIPQFGCHAISIGCRPHLPPDTPVWLRPRIARRNPIGDGKDLL